MAASDCKSSTQEVEAGGQEPTASLGSVQKICTGGRETAFGVGWWVTRQQQAEEVGKAGVVQARDPNS